MLNLNRPTLLQNITATNKYLQQAGDAMINTLSSSLSLGANMAKCCLSTAKASTYGYFIYKTACSEIVGNLPVLSISASAGLFPGAGLAYGILSDVGTRLVSHPVSSFTLLAACSFVQWTNGVENIQDTISSTGNVLGDGIQLVKELYNASDSAINTVNSALKSCLIQGSNDDDQDTDDDQEQSTITGIVEI